MRFDLTMSNVARWHDDSFLRFSTLHRGDPPKLMHASLCILNTNMIADARFQHTKSYIVKSVSGTEIQNSLESDSDSQYFYCMFTVHSFGFFSS